MLNALNAAGVACSAAAATTVEEMPHHPRTTTTTDTNPLIAKAVGSLSSPELEPRAPETETEGTQHMVLAEILADDVVKELCESIVPSTVEGSCEKHLGVSEKSMKALGWTEQALMKIGITNYAPLSGPDSDWYPFAWKVWLELGPPGKDDGRRRIKGGVP